MVTINDFLAWAWARHHSILSWYVRPLFIVPYCYLAYRRSIVGIVLTIVALLTSMFWFPAPETPNQMVVQFLQAEREYLTGPWTLPKVLLALAIPIFFFLLALAFWRRSWLVGLAVINLAALGKMVWSILEGDGAGWAVLPPALIGLVICDGVIILAYRQVRKRVVRAE